LKKDVIVAGVGGQGVLSACRLIADAGLRQGLAVKTVETRGMAQRGGPVCAHVRLSDSVVHSAVIPVGKVDLILAIEPVEGLRYLHALRHKGHLLANVEPFDVLGESLDRDQVMDDLRLAPHCTLLSASSIAREAGSPRSTNVVMLGAAATQLPMDICHFEEALRARFKAKGDAVTASALAAFHAGFGVCGGDEPPIP
jgi:indolepyruvate ferredoxin oxidoreductase, beta subunit